MQCIRRLEWSGLSGERQQICLMHLGRQDHRCGTDRSVFPVLDASFRIDRDDYRVYWTACCIFDRLNLPRAILSPSSVKTKRTLRILGTSIRRVSGLSQPRVFNIEWQKRKWHVQAEEQELPQFLYHMHQEREHGRLSIVQNVRGWFRWSGDPELPSMRRRINSVWCCEVVSASFFRHPFHSVSDAYYELLCLLDVSKV